MKLKANILLHDVGDMYMAVSPEYSGLIRNNEPAQFIFRQLLKETTEEAIVDAMFERYDAPREVLAADVHRILEDIRNVGILDE